MKKRARLLALLMALVMVVAMFAACGGEEDPATTTTAATTAATGTRPALVSENVAATMSAVEGFPTDDASKAALIPSYVGMEWPVVEKLSEIQTVINEEHSLIMTREIDVEEGIEEMNERVAELFE